MSKNIAEKEYISESQELRSNLWTFCIYPESIPNDYLRILQSEIIVPTLLGPLHDADINGNGMEKKPHYHVMMYFGKGKNVSYTQVMRYVKKLNGCPCEVVTNSVGMIRYFIHRDNPEKSRRSQGMDRDWKIEDLLSFHGFEYLDAFESKSDENEYYKCIEQFCEDNNIYNYYVLTEALKGALLTDELNFLRRHSIHFRAYLLDKYNIIKRLTTPDDVDNIKKFNLNIDIESDK